MRSAELLPLIVLPLLLAGCNRKPPPDPDLLAKVGSQEIRTAALREAMAQRHTGATEQEKEALLQELVERAALVQKAIDKGLDKDPDVRRSFENLLIGKLRETQTVAPAAGTAPTSEQLQAAYDATPESWQEPGMRRAALIFIATPPRTSDTRKAELRSRMETARAKALGLPQDDPAIHGFGRVAVEYSEDQATRYQGGEVGWVRSDKPDGRFDPAVTKALFAATQPGAVSEILETERGFYLVKLLEIRPARVKPLDEVRQNLQQKLKLQNSRDLESHWKKEARESVKIELFPDALKAVPPQPASPKAADGPPIFK